MVFVRKNTEGFCAEDTFTLDCLRKSFLSPPSASFMERKPCMCVTSVRMYKHSFRTEDPCCVVWMLWNKPVSFWTLVWMHTQQMQGASFYHALWSLTLLTCWLLGQGNSIGCYHFQQSKHDVRAQRFLLLSSPQVFLIMKPRSSAVGITVVLKSPIIFWSIVKVLWYLPK